MFGNVWGHISSSQVVAVAPASSGKRPGMLPTSSARTGQPDRGDECAGRRRECRGAWKRWREGTSGERAGPCGVTQVAREGVMGTGAVTGTNGGGKGEHVTA